MGDGSRDCSLSGFRRPACPASGRTPKTLYSSVCWTFLEVEPDERARLSPPACPVRNHNLASSRRPSHRPPRSLRTGPHAMCEAKHGQRNSSAPSFRSFLRQRVPILHGTRHEAALAMAQEAFSHLRASEFHTSNEVSHPTLRFLRPLS